MKMKAAVVTQNSDGNVEIVEREIRPLEHGETLVEVDIALANFTLVILPRAPELTIVEILVSICANSLFRNSSTFLSTPRQFATVKL